MRSVSVATLPDLPCRSPFANQVVGQEYQRHRAEELEVEQQVTPCVNLIPVPPCGEHRNKALNNVGEEEFPYAVKTLVHEVPLRQPLDESYTEHNAFPALLFQPENWMLKVATMGRDVGADMRHLNVL